MTKRAVKRLSLKKTPRANSVIEIKATSEADLAAATARTLTSPEVGAASTIEQWQPDTHDVNELVKELQGQVKAVNSGNLERAEGMLIAQAHTLNEVFNNLMRRAVGQQYLKQWETYMRMGLKAQNQCRMTLETLAEIKNPRPVAFVKQANINNGGQQQVNNPERSAQARASAYTEDSSTQQTKLLEKQHGQWMDAGAKGSSSGADPHMATVGKSDWPEN